MVVEHNGITDQENYFYEKKKEKKRKYAFKTDKMHASAEFYTGDYVEHMRHSIQKQMESFRLS